MQVVLGVDPGASGGLAICVGGKMHSAFPMPHTGRDIIDLIEAAIDGASDKIAFVEQVSGYIGDNQPGSAAFQFGYNDGYVLGVLEAMRIRVVLVRPQEWQKALGLGISGRKRAPSGSSEEERARIKRDNAHAKAEWKRKLKERAQQLYPDVKVTLATADALLLLEFGLRTLNRS